MKAKIDRAIICLDGEPPSPKIFKKIIQKSDFLIAADGGANWMDSYGVVPDLLIGDLDGVRKDVRKKIPASNVIENKDQYSTDLEKAFAWVVEKKIKFVIVFAAAGKRIDHTLSNFSLLWQFSKKTNIEVIHDSWNAVLLSNRKRVFATRTGVTVSLIPFSNCSGVTLKGFQYPLTLAPMKMGEVGVSNVTTSPEVQIEIEKGRMLAIFLDKV